MRSVLFAALVLSVGPGLMAQQADAAKAADPCAADARPSFDVVSVKPSESDSRSSSMRGTPDGVIITSSLRRMILSAFTLHDFQLSGGPDWVATSTWVLTAKNDAPDPDSSKMTQEERKAQFDKRMQELQAALMDRFQLKCHMTTKELPIYQLVQAKGGARLKETTAEQGKQGNTSINGRNGTIHAVATGITSERIATMLGNEVDRLVVDKTGLKGNYDVTMDWVHDAQEPNADAASGPTVFTALEEQLGLKLEPVKGPVPLLVIDHIEKPAEN
jgi:uncharacterized protein (TIGR03435 family)